MGVPVFVKSHPFGVDGLFAVAVAYHVIGTQIAGYLGPRLREKAKAGNDE